MEAARALEALAYTYYTTSEYDAADSLFHDSLGILLEHYDAMHPALVGCYQGLGDIANLLERYQESQDYHQRALDIRLEQFGPRHKLTASGYASLAAAQAHFDLEAAEANERKAIAIWEELGTDRTNLAATYNNLAIKVNSRGDIGEAVDLVRKAVDLYRELGFEDSHYANTLNTWGVWMTQAGDYASAERTFREALELNVSLAGPNTLHAAVCHLGLSRALVGLGEFAEALEQARMGHEKIRAVLGENHRFTAAAQCYVGDAQWRSGEITSGRLMLESGLSLQREFLPLSAWRASQTLLWLGELHLESGDPGTAEPLLREALEFRLDLHPEASWAVAEVQLVLARSLADQGRSQAARDLLERANPSLVRHLGEADHRALAARELLVSLQTSE